MQTKPRRPSLLAQVSAVFFREPTPLADRKPLCAGAATGYQCRHYLPRGRVAGGYVGEINGERIRFDDEAEFQRTRHCTVTSPTNPLDKDPARLPAYCPRYEATARPFDPLFEVAPPKDLDLPAMLPGAIPAVGIGTPAMNALVKAHNSGDRGPNMPKVWDEEPGAPVLPRLPGDAPDAPARRGFTHLEIEDNRTACGQSNHVKCATLVPGDLAKTVAQVNCPGCLGARATNVGIDTIVKAMADRLMDQLTEAANKAHEDATANPHAAIEPDVSTQKDGENV